MHDALYSNAYKNVCLHFSSIAIIIALHWRWKFPRMRLVCRLRRSWHFAVAHFGFGHSSACVNLVDVSKDLSLNQAALINMVQRVDWNDAISGGSTLRPEGAQAPKSWLATKFIRPLDTLWSIDSQKNSKFDATRCQILRLKWTKFDFRFPTSVIVELFLIDHAVIWLSMKFHVHLKQTLICRRLVSQFLPALSCAATDNTRSTYAVYANPVQEEPCSPVHVELLIVP